MCSPLVRRLHFYHLLWSVFQSSLYIIILHFWKTFCEQLSMYFIYTCPLTEVTLLTPIITLRKEGDILMLCQAGCKHCNSNSDQKNPLPCQDLNPWPPWNQSNLLPTELSWLDLCTHFKSDQIFWTNFYETISILNIRNNSGIKCTHIYFRDMNWRLFGIKSTFKLFRIKY